MSFDLDVTASVQLTPREAAEQPGPACGPFPFGFSLVDVAQPWTQGLRVLPGDTFVGGEKVIDVPAHMRRSDPANDPGRQAFFLVKTDLPVTVQVRDDTDGGPITFERRLEVGGSIMIAGGGPDVDQIAFENANAPYANVSVWIVARA